MFRRWNNFVNNQVFGLQDKMEYLLFEFLLRTQIAAVSALVLPAVCGSGVIAGITSAANQLVLVELSG